jgi:hypothetical protein
VAEHTSEFEPIGCGGHKSATSCSALYSTVAASGLPESVCFAMAASGLPESVQYSAVAYCTVQYSTVQSQYSAASGESSALFCCDCRKHQSWSLGNTQHSSAVHSTAQHNTVHQCCAGVAAVAVAVAKRRGWGGGDARKWRRRARSGGKGRMRACPAAEEAEDGEAAGRKAQSGER